MSKDQNAGVEVHFEDPGDAASFATEVDAEMLWEIEHEEEVMPPEDGDPGVYLVIVRSLVPGPVFARDANPHIKQHLAEMVARHHGAFTAAEAGDPV